MGPSEPLSEFDRPVEPQQDRSRSSPLQSLAAPHEHAFRVSDGLSLPLAAYNLSGSIRPVPKSGSKTFVDLHAFGPDSP